MAGIHSKQRHPNALNYDSFQSEAFTVNAALGAGVASTTLQGIIILPFSAKVVQVSVFYTAIGTPLVGHLWNIAVGSGAYQTGTSGVPASGTYTVGGAFTAGQTVTANIAGIAVPITPVAGDTNNTGVATRLAALINANTNLISTGPFAGFPLNKVVGASSAAAVVTVQAIACGTAGNSITTTAITNSTQTLTAGAATLTAGANSTAITTNPVDTFATNLGQYTFAANGQAMFANDQSFPVSPSLYGYNVVPTVWDGIYKSGTPLTLRVTTPASTGSLTNLTVVLGLKTIDIVDTKPRQTFPVFNPYSDIG
jgi:hypothetical protein